jgi:hypothetical protein
MTENKALILYFQQAILTQQRYCLLLAAVVVRMQLEMGLMVVLVVVVDMVRVSLVD